MDVHALGAPLGAWREGISGSTMPLYPTRGRWLPYRGREMEIWRKPLSLPLQHTYLEVVGSNPETAENFFCTKFKSSHEEMISMLMLTFLSYFFPIQLVWCCIDPSFLLFLLPLQSLRKLYVVPTKSLRNFPIFLFYPIPSRPRLGNSQLERAL